MYRGKVELGAERLKVEATAKAGLNIEGASRAISEIADQGVARFTAIGKDQQGAKAKLTEKTSEIKAPMPNLPSEISPVARQMVEKFKGLVSEGILPKPIAPKSVCEKLTEKLPSLRILAQTLFKQKTKKDE